MRGNGRGVVHVDHATVGDCDSRLSLIAEAHDVPVAVQFTAVAGSHQGGLRAPAERTSTLSTLLLTVRATGAHPLSETLLLTAACITCKGAASDARTKARVVGRRS